MNTTSHTPARRRGLSSRYFEESWYTPNNPFGEYAAEQIADQVQNGEPPIVAHIRSRAVRFHDPFNIESLKTPRSQARNPTVAKHAVANC